MKKVSPYRSIVNIEQYNGSDAQGVLKEGEKNQTTVPEKKI